MDNPIADVVLRNGTILTFDAESSRSRSIGISNDRIAAIGAADRIDSMIGRQTTVIDLDGRAVTPGINDTHAHMEREGLKRIRISLAGLRSVTEITNRIASATRNVPA